APRASAPLRRHAFPVHPRSEPAEHRSRVPPPHELPFHDGRPGDCGFRGGTRLRRPASRATALPQAVCGAVAFRAPVHPARGAVADAGPGDPTLRQHDERSSDRRASPESRPALLSGYHAGVRSPDRRHPGLHLRHAGAGLHRIGHSRSRGPSRARRDGPSVPPCLGGMMAMSGLDWIGIVSIIMASVAVSVGSIAPALAEGRAIVQGLAAIAQQPDEANAISRTLFIGLAIIESSGIYCFVIAIVLIFANPFWNSLVSS